jgi:predicted phage baseplate assembly protein
VAVTAEDFERLACEASSRVARVRCLPVADGGAPGTVSLLLVPALPPPTGPLKREEMLPTETLRREVREYLDERRLLCVELRLEPAPCLWVSAVVRVKAKRRVDREQLQLAIEQRLYRFIHPVYGGPDGAGWPFGRPLHQGEVYAAVQAIPGVEYVEAAQLLLWDTEGKGPPQPCEKVEPPPNGLLCSGHHQVSVG